MTTAIAFLIGVYTGWTIVSLFDPPGRNAVRRRPIARPNAKDAWFRLTFSIGLVAIFFSVIKNSIATLIFVSLIVGVLGVVAICFLYLALAVDTPRGNFKRLQCVLRGLILKMISAMSDAAAISRPARRTILALTLAGIALGAAVVYGTKDAISSSLMLWLSPPSHVGAALGLLLGLFAGANREIVVRNAETFSKSLIGAGDESSWVLQAIVGVLVLAIVIETANPSLVQHLTEFHAGQFEAKFSEVSSQTRETITLGINDFTQKISMETWINFYEELQPGHARRIAEHEFDKTPGKEDRERARDLILKHYFKALAIIISCYVNDNREQELQNISNFGRLVDDLKSQISEFDSNGAPLDWKPFLDSVDCIVRRLMAKAENMPSRVKITCNYKDISQELNAARTEKNIEDANDATKKSFLALKNENFPTLKDHSLTGMDAYIVAFIGDIIAIISSKTEKANFLINTENKYSRDDDYINPGIINLYYQAADAMYRSGAAWSVRDKLNQIDFALDKANLYRRKALISLGDENRQKVETQYGRSAIVFLTLSLEIMNDEGFSGRTISPAFRRKWTQAFAFLNEIFRAQGKSAGLEIIDSDISEFDDEENAKWTLAYHDLQPSFRFDAFVAMALGASLLTSERGHSTAAGCATAFFYLREAEDLQPDVDYDYSAADRMRLKGYLSQVKDRIDAGCS